MSPGYSSNDPAVEKQRHIEECVTDLIHSIYSRQLSFMFARSLCFTISA